MGEELEPPYGAEVESSTKGAVSPLKDVTQLACVWDLDVLGESYFYEVQGLREGGSRKSVKFRLPI